MKVLKNPDQVLQIMNRKLDELRKKFDAADGEESPRRGGRPSLSGAAGGGRAAPLAENHRGRQRLHGRGNVQIWSSPLGSSLCGHQHGRPADRALGYSAADPGAQIERRR